MPCKCWNEHECERDGCGWLVENNRKLRIELGEIEAGRDLEAIKERLRRETNA